MKPPNIKTSLISCCSFIGETRWLVGLELQNLDQLNPRKKLGLWVEKGHLRAALIGDFVCLKFPKFPKLPCL